LVGIQTPNLRYDPRAIEYVGDSRCITQIHGRGRLLALVAAGDLRSQPIRRANSSAGGGEESMSERPSWDQYFMLITRQVADRSTCNRAKVGAVIVRDKNILATGYNGSPAGLPHCTEVGCLIYESRTPSGEIEENCFRTIHAEINAIAQAAKNGSSIRDADIYITHTPCIHCFKVLINTGIKRVLYEKPYKLATLDELRGYCDVGLIQVPM
jgi:dCMP deaminase